MDTFGTYVRTYGKIRKSYQDEAKGKAKIPDTDKPALLGYPDIIQISRYQIRSNLHYWEQRPQQEWPGLRIPPVKD